MNKQELEIAKKIAEIEGVELSEMPNDLTGNYETMSAPYISYDPFRWEILGPLMLKHNVCVIPSVNCGFTNVSIGVNDSIWCGEKEEIPRAILECIIKSKED